MSPVRALLVLLALALAAAPALAQEGNGTDTGNGTAPDAGAAPGEGEPDPATPEPVSFTLLSANVGGRFVWTLEGQTQANPTLTVQPGAEVTITIRNADGIPHNLRVSPAGSREVIAKSPNINAEGDVQVITFTAPESGTLQYICEIHATEMKGNIRIQAAGGGQPAGGGDDAGNITGPTVALGELTDAEGECADRPVPALVADNVIGGPTANDYLERCVNPNAGGVAEVPPHAADYVIPISWALIGLGVVGVVWAHRFYNP